MIAGFKRKPKCVTDGSTIKSLATFRATLLLNLFVHICCFQVAGWLFEPLPDNPKHTKATLISEIDLKGSIPKSIYSQVYKEQGLSMNDIKKHIAKFLKENPHLDPEGALL